MVNKHYPSEFKAEAAALHRSRAVHARRDGTNGAARVTAELHDRGEQVNHKEVARVMRRYRHRPALGRCPAAGAIAPAALRGAGTRTQVGRRR